MGRMLTLLGLGLVAVAASVLRVDAAPAANASKPNILFIVVDDLGFDDVGFRSHQIKTPNIDGLASEALLLERYYVQDVCSPSRASIMTGRYAMHHGIVDWIPPKHPYGLPLNETTMADKLRDGGYDTHAIGKWHLGLYKWDYTPTFRGFNSFLGFYSGGEDYFYHMSSGGYDMHRDPVPRCGKGCSQAALDLNGTYSTTAFTQEAVRIIEDYTTDEPLFLYLAYQAVHAPAEAPQRYIDAYADIIPDKQRRIFAGMLSCLDEGIGNVTDALKRAGMYENTLIVFTTDNGGPVITGDAVGSRNFPLRGGKHTVYEGGVRGTAFVKPHKGAFDKTGTGYHNLMHAADWLPTMCDAAGVDCKTPQSKDGVSHWDAMRHAHNSTLRSDVVLGNATDLCSGHCGFAYRNGDWKYIKGTGGEPFGWSRPIKSGGNCNMAFNTCTHGTELLRAEIRTPEECCYLCTTVADCAAFTLMSNVTEDPCVLLSTANSSTVDSNCISGAKDPTEAPYVDIAPSGHQLFNIAQDPFEHNDLASQQPNVTHKLGKKLDTILQTYTEAQDDPKCPFQGWPQTRYGPIVEPWC